MNSFRRMSATKRDSLIIFASIMDMTGDIFQYVFLKSFILPFPFNLIQELICHYKVLDFAFQLYSPLAGIVRMLKILHKQRLSAWTCFDQIQKDHGFFQSMKMWTSELIACWNAVLQSCLNQRRSWIRCPCPESDCESRQWCLS